jgi:hypothetical protein
MRTLAVVLTAAVVATVASRHYGLDRDASVKKFLIAKFSTGDGLDIGGTIRGLV